MQRVRPLPAGFLDGELRARGTKAIVLPYGVGRYSPVQDYLAHKKLLKKYRPDVLVVNFYTGNDVDYHLLPAASRIIGKRQADTILGLRRSPR